MDIIKMTRQLGAEIQKQDFFIKHQLAKQNSDEDASLQELIGEFNLKRMAVSNEASKQADSSSETMQQLNQEMRDVYQKIMENKNMQDYNEAKEQLDSFMQRIFAIISQSAEGEDPETTDYQPSCGGSCSGCSGCH